MKNYLLLYLTFFLNSIVFGASIQVEVLKDSSDLDIAKALSSNDFILIEANAIHSLPTNLTYWVKLTGSWTDNDYLLLGNNINNYEDVYCIGFDSQLLKHIKVGTDQFFESNTYLPSIQLDRRYSKVILKVKSNSFLKESFQIRGIKEVNLVNVKYLLLYLTVFVVLFVLAVYLALLFFKSKKKVVLYYLLYILAVILATFFISNYGRYFLWDKLPFSNTYIEGTMAMLMVVSYNLFASKATYLSSWSIKLHRINLVFIIVYPVLFIFLILTQSTHIIAVISGVFPGIALVLLIVMVIQNLKNSNPNSYYFLFGFLFFLMGVVFRILVNNGWAIHSFLMEVIIFISIMFEMIVFSYVVINFLSQEILKGKESQEKLFSSLLKIEELKVKIEQLNESFEKHQNTAAFMVDESVNDLLVSPLSKREIEVLNSIVKGGKYKEISVELHISINTLKTHVSRIYSKLDINNRLDAVNKITKLVNLKK
jgi:DNA-binding CsgD family transcriptional regulator